MSLSKSLLLAGAVLATVIPLGVADAAPLPNPLSGMLQAITAKPQLKLLAPAPASQPVQFDVVLPLRNTALLDQLLAAQQNPNSPFYHKWLTPGAFSAQFGPSMVTMNAAAGLLQMFGFQVTQRSRSIHVSGTTAQVNQVFGTTLQAAVDAFGQQRLVSASPIAWPGVLSTLGAIIPAFNPTAFQPRPSMRNGAAGYMRNGAAGYMRNGAAGYGTSGNLSTPPACLFYSDLKQAYDFPSYQTKIGQGAKAPRLDGTGTTVAVVMSSDVQDSDVSALFDATGFRATTGASADPAIYSRVPVTGGNPYSATNPAAEEAALAVEQVLGAAPGSRLELYVTPDLSDQSLISALNQIDTDDSADVVSLSFGQCELYYTAAYNGGIDETPVLGIYSELFKQGNAEGITFVAASGDSGGNGCLSPSYFTGGTGTYVAGVSVPAADPDVTAVGGTNLVDAAAGGGTGAADAGENAWSAPAVPEDPYGLGVPGSGGLFGAGGGVSTLFAQPSWQEAVSTGSTSWRTVPDVGMHVGGCPTDALSPCNGGSSALDGSGNTDRSMLNMVWNGAWDTAVGTSAAAPQFAGVVAMMVEMSGRQGNLNPTIYAMAQNQAAGGAGAFHQSVPGFDGIAGNAGSYNYTTGVGTLDVAQFLGLGAGSKAGTPGTPTNP